MINQRLGEFAASAVQQCAEKQTFSSLRMWISLLVRGRQYGILPLRTCALDGMCPVRISAWGTLPSSLPSREYLRWEIFGCQTLLLDDKVAQFRPHRLVALQPSHKEPRSTEHWWHGQCFQFYRKELQRDATTSIRVQALGSLILRSDALRRASSSVTKMASKEQKGRSIKQS